MTLLRVLILTVAAVAFAAAPALAQKSSQGGSAVGSNQSIIGAAPDGTTFSYGDNTSEYANDGECDDPRFYGPAMAAAINVKNIGHDSVDCKQGMDSGRLRYRDWRSELANTNCASIDYGNDTSQYANDGECDDPRFAGFGVDGILINDDQGKDASDCRHLCQYGYIWLRSTF